VYRRATRNKSKLLRAAVPAWPACAIAVALLLALAAGATAATPSHQVGDACGRIDFAPQSDNIAFDIRTFGVPCSAARAVAGASRSSALRPGADHSYQAAGFRCLGQFVQPRGKSYEHYVCASGSGRVVFDRG
jgi:hypothetical protein